MFALLYLVCVNVFATEYETNELPMYGGQHDPQVEANKDYSRGAASLGWKYLSHGDLSTAMKRFNQAWMFDRRNPDAFWGFGIIMGRRAEKEDTEKNLTESIHLLATAHELIPDNGKITGDLAFSYALLGNYLATQGRDAKKDYEKAEELFASASKQDPRHPPTTANWAVLKYYVGDYKAAKKLISDAQQAGFSPDPSFLKDLTEKAK